MGGEGGRPQRRTDRLTPMPQRNEDARSRRENRERALRIICSVFGFERRTIGSKRNMSDPDMPYMFTARNKGEYIAKMSRLDQAKGGDGVLSLESVAGFGGQAPRKRKRRRKRTSVEDPTPVSPTRKGPKYASSGDPPDWTATTAAGYNPEADILRHRRRKRRRRRT